MHVLDVNGDGLNDVLRVYGYKIATLKLVVFNQWGEKLFETADQSRGWDGTYKGKQQVGRIIAMPISELQKRADGKGEEE